MMDKMYKVEQIVKDYLNVKQIVQKEAPKLWVTALDMAGGDEVKAVLMISEAVKAVDGEKK